MRPIRCRHSLKRAPSATSSPRPSSSSTTTSANSPASIPREHASILPTTCRRLGFTDKQNYSHFRETDVFEKRSAALTKLVSLRPQSNNTYRGVKPCRLLRSWNLLLTFFGSRHCKCAYIYIQKRGGNITVDLSLFFPLNYNFMNKLKFNDCFKN